MLITEEADKKAQAAEALAKEAENLQGQVLMEALQAFCWEPDDSPGNPAAGEG